MAVRFAMSGGNFIISQGASVAGIWGTVGSGNAINSAAPTGRATSYAFYNTNPGAFSISLQTPVLGSGYTTLIAGVAFYTTSFSSNTALIQFKDSSGNIQCQLRMNITGTLYFADKNGTQIGSGSTQAILLNAWQYIEFKATFSNSGSGTCEVRVNAVTWVTSTGLTNAQNTNGGAIVLYTSDFHTQSYMCDFYALDTASGRNTNYLGDVTVGELFPNGAGVNSQWTANVGPFSLTSVNNASGSTTVYNGTITGGTSNAYQGYYIVITGFGHSADNGTFLCTASNTTALTLANGSGVSETNTASAAFQAIVQPGIHGGLIDNSTTNVGTRPNQDETYISDSTSGDISDYAHQSLSLTGTLYGIVHQTYARKDDAGTRMIAQVCISTGTTEVSSNISLNNTYTYYQDILENDPHTGSAWTVSNFNSATFGVKELT